MSSAVETLVEQARAIERPIPVPGVSGLYGVEAAGQSVQVTEPQLRELRSRFGSALTAGFGRVNSRVVGGMAGHQHLAQLRDDQWAVSAVSEHMPHGKALLAAALLPGIGTAILAEDIRKVSEERRFPDLLMWVEPAESLGRGRKALGASRLVDAATELGKAESSAGKAYKALERYREGVIEGAESAVETLEVTRDVSIATVGLIAAAPVAAGGLGLGLVGSAALGAGATGVTALAGQTTEVVIGTRQEIDWAGIGFDAVLSFLLSWAGGKLAHAAGERILATAIGKQWGATAGRQVVRALVADLVTGELFATVQVTAKALFDEARGKREKLTWDEYVDQLSATLLDPKSILMNAIQGAVSRRLAGAQARKNTAPGSGARGAGGHPIVEPAPATTVPHEPAADSRSTPRAETSSTADAPAASFPKPTLEAHAPGAELPEFQSMGRTANLDPGPQQSIELGPREHPQGFGATEVDARTVADQGGEGALELDRRDYTARESIAPQQRSVDFDLASQPATPGGIEAQVAQEPHMRPESTFELDPAADSSPLELDRSDRSGGFGAEVDARARDYAPGAPEKLTVYKAKKNRHTEGVAGYDDLTQERRLPGVKKREDTFGAPSTEKDGSGNRKGIFYGEWNAAEIERGLRIDWDRNAGRPRKVVYRVDSDIAGSPGSDPRSYQQDTSTPGAQSSDSAYTNSGYERGHLAQLEAFKNGTPEAQAEANRFTNLVPQKPELNRGAYDSNGVWQTSEWRLSEQRTVDVHAKKYGSVVVEVVPHYSENPPRLSDGTPIPDSITRRVIAPDGTVLEDAVHVNR